MTFPEREARRATALRTVRRQTPQKPVIPAEGSAPTSTERQKQTLRPGRYEEPQDPKIFGLGAAKIIGVQLRGAGAVASGMKSWAGRKRTCDARRGPKRHWRPSGKPVRGFSLSGIVRLLAVYAVGVCKPQPAITPVPVPAYRRRANEKVVSLYATISFQKSSRS